MHVGLEFWFELKGQCAHCISSPLVCGEGGESGSLGVGRGSETVHALLRLEIFPSLPCRPVVPLLVHWTMSPLFPLPLWLWLFFIRLNSGMVPFCLLLFQFLWTCQGNFLPDRGRILNHALTLLNSTIPGWQDVCDLNTTTDFGLPPFLACFTFW